MGRGLGAVIFGGMAVVGYAAWRELRNKEQEPQFVYVPQPSSGGGNDGNIMKNKLISWGVDTLFSALGGQSGAQVYDASAGGGTVAGDWGFDLGNIFGGSGSTGGGYQVDRPATGGSSLGSLLDLIGNAEAPGGYNTVYGGSKIQPPKPLSQMTVGEVLDWQDRSVAAGSVSSAAGRYQVIRGTLRDQVNAGTVSLNDRYDANTQDRIAESLIRGRGLSDYEAGRISADKFGNNLAQEWAGLPVLTGGQAGRSYYDGYAGNSATTTVSAVRDALGRLF